MRAIIEEVQVCNLLSYFLIHYGYCSCYCNYCYLAFGL